MDKDFFIQLTIGLYKVTEMFPKKEPLKMLIRKRANIILADLILFYSNPDFSDRLSKKVLLQRILKNIIVLCGYFKVADSQDWIDKRNFLVLKINYDKIKNELKNRVSLLDNCGTHLIRDKNKKKNFPEITFSKQINFISKHKSAGKNIDKDIKHNISNKRHQKIIEYLRANGSLYSKELVKEFPQVSARTIRRDINYLLKNNFIKKQSNNTIVFYECAEKE